MRFLGSPGLHVLVWTILVGIGMLLPGDALPPIASWLPLSLEGWVDKFEHFVAFLVMTLLVFRALRGAAETGHTRKLLVRAAALTFAYALVLEILQIPHPSRYWAPADIVADALGVGAAVWWISRLTKP